MSDVAPPNRLRLSLVALVVVLALGLLGSLVYRLRKPAVMAARPAPVKPTVGEPSAPPQLPPPADNALERARRAAAVAAIESGEYKVAIDALTEILKKGKGVGDEVELLRIAKDLESRGQRPAAKPDVPLAAPVVRPPAPVAPARKPVVAKPAVVDRAAERDGQLLVFSVPVGLAVEVDGSDFGVTPVRRAIAPGSHFVVVFKDGIRLNDKTVEVKPGDVSTIDFDVREKLLARSEPVARAAPVALPTSEPEKPTPVLPPEPVAPPADEPVERPSNNDPRGTGEIFVAPSSLGGEVFINGTSYGESPLLAREVREGAAVVELRSNGETKRRKEVVVRRSERVEVRFR
jgi:hypothetical protein